MKAVPKRGSQKSGGKLCRGVSLLRLAVPLAAIFAFSCTQLQKPEPEPFFAQAVPPIGQELRWSNGRLPRSFDPALAAAPPETDLVRAVYEGLTETDPATLTEVPAAAESWSSSDDHRVWTFKLRKNARWSNGRHVTAGDFVRSWKRLVKLGDKVQHRNLLSNIVGVPKRAADPAAPLYPGDNPNQSPANAQTQLAANSNARPPQAPPANTDSAAQPSVPLAETQPFGVIADDDITLKVSLVLPDKEFPRLVANSIFRPIFSNGEEFVGKELNTNPVTNGPFRATAIDAKGIVLERSQNYWNRDAIRLERVRLVAADSPETALAAYRAGELDAITNADFSPLVLRLLSPYEDFRKTTHSALNFYQVNAAKPPFSDRRVRQALSNAIERERLAEDEMEGTTRPALGFLPNSPAVKAPLTQDKETAKELLEEAGFPGGEGFPVIRLLVNRNDAQQRIAKSVARMWKQNLNLDTEIVVKDAAEVERLRAAGDFDLVRRGVVFPTSDQTASLMSIFEPIPKPAVPAATPAAQPSPTPLPKDPFERETAPFATEQKPQIEFVEPVILTEEDAVYELRAIPLYFPTSFALIKPYVAGFETNSLDAINLSSVAIDSDWRPAKRAGE